MKPPTGLSRSASALWRRLQSAYELTPGDLETLREACRAWDRAEQARQLVDREGLTFVDRLGEPRPHPACALELRHRSEFARLMKALRLDGDAEVQARPRSPGF